MMDLISTMPPVRITLSRKKGFKLQDYSKSINGLGCKIVSRPSKFGNPLKLHGDSIYILKPRDKYIVSKWTYLCKGDEKTLLELFEGIITGILPTYDDYIYIDGILFWINEFKKLNLSELKGHNLACWCNPAHSCHVDVLLKLLTDE